MDSSYRSFDDDAVMEVASPLAAHDERRLHVRAYDYWMSLLNGRPCPLIEDLDPTSLSDFAQNSVLLDFCQSKDNPGITYLGRALREECGILYGIRSVEDVPDRSLLSRLTEQYADILVNQRPTSFEAEFINHKGLPTLYRGILLPLSSNGGAIDFVYGVISWKHDARNADAEVAAEAFTASATAGLVDHLATARASAETAQRSESRAHSALYSAIGLAFDFSLAAQSAPEEFAELLERERLTVQERAPMTPIVKLVFGAEYDKKRLTEYASALNHAHHVGLGSGELTAYLEQYDGGLKALVIAERARRAPASKPDPLAQAREELRGSPPRALIELDTGDDEFIVLLARRVEPGRVVIVSAIAEPSVVDRVLLKSVGAQRKSSIRFSDPHSV